MIPIIPWYITLTIVATTASIAATVWYLVTAGARRAGLDPSARRRLSVGTALGFGGWFGGVLVLSPSLASLQQGDPFRVTPIIPLVALAGIVGAILVYWRSAELRRAIAAIPGPALIAVQYWRVVGATFVILFTMGQLPAHFALPAGWGDVAVGLLAPLVALALARTPAFGHPLAFVWNAVGLVDLVVAVGMGTGRLAPLLVPSLGTHVPAATAMGAFPMILVPAFGVPVSMLLHFLSFRQLIAGGEEGIGGLEPRALQGRA